MNAAKLVRITPCLALSVALALAFVPLPVAQAAGTDVADAAASELAAELSEQLAEQRQVMEQAETEGIDPHRALAARNAQKRRNATAPSESEANKHSARKKSASLPSEYYLTNLGLVTEVKDQGNWSNCWAHGGVAALESAVLKQTSGKDADEVSMEEPQLTDLPSASSGAPDYSERHLTYFALQKQTQATGGNQEGEGAYCASPFRIGGYDQLTEALWTAQQGIVAEAKYSYPEATLSSDDTHRLDTSGVLITDMVYLDSPVICDGIGTSYEGYDASATQAIKETLMEKGIVAMGINAAKANASDSDDSWCQYNNQGTFNVDHEVAVVGWDDDFPASNFGTTNPAADAASNPEWGYTSADGTYNGAWLVKNSWGADWGLADSAGNKTGFFWISYYDHSIESLTAFETIDELGGYENVHQYDYLGVAYGGSSCVSSLAVANIFTAGEDAAAPNGQGTGGAELLRAVSVRPQYASTSDVDIKIYLMDSNDATPADGTPVHEQTVKNLTCGFHIIDLDKEIQLKRGQRYAVVEEITFEENGDTLCDLALEAADDEGSITYNAIVNEGETLVFYNDEWIDVQALNEKLGNNGYNHMGNALIKAYTDNPTDVSDAIEIDTAGETLTYDGTAKEFANLVVSVGGTTLTDADYTAEYSNNVDAGTGALTVTVEGGGMFGTKTVPFTIERSAISPSVALSATSFVYSGKAKTPAATVKCGTTRLMKNVDYTVAYANNKNVGTAKVTVTCTGNYSGSASATFTINPKGTTLKKLKPTKKAFTATWAKQTAQTTGYELRYSLKKNMKGAKTKTVKKAKTAKLTVKKLKASKKYWVQVRTYKVSGGKKYCSVWSAKKRVKTK